MTNFYALITNKGLASLTTAKVSGNNVNISHLAVGDSLGIYKEPEASQTVLVNECARVPINRIVTDSNYTNQLIIEAAIPSVIGGFFIREIGIFDEQGTLFAVAKYPVTYKPINDEGSGKDLYIRLSLSFSSSPNITIFENPHNALVSTDSLTAFALKDFSNVANENKSHQIWPDLQGGNQNERYHLNLAEFNTIETLQAFLTEVNEDKYLVIDKNGTGLTLMPSTEILQNLTIVNDFNIVIKEQFSIYKTEISTETTYTFNATEVSGYKKVITFELLINLKSVITPNFPTSVKWLNNEAPEFDEIGNYLLAFRSFDFGNNWVGSLQGKWL